MGRMPALMLCSLLAAGPSTACGSNPTAPAMTTTAAAFVGTWQNVDSQTPSMPQIIISMQGSQLVVHAYGSCFPVNCDWGQMTVPLPTNGTVSVVWPTSFNVVTQSMTIVGTQLRSALHTHFTDSSGRPDFDNVDVFNKTS